MRPPIPGLRPIHHDASSPARVELIVPADDTLVVSDDVAEQLLSSSTQFKDGYGPEPTAEVAEAEPVPDGTVDEVLAWAGTDADRLAAALEAEQAKSKPRVSLIDALTP